jgi:large subunit ribosomal protein L15
MRQNDLKPAEGSKHARKRVGRGDGSGHGSYSGRGCKGQKSRSGFDGARPGFEGGQLPMVKRLPWKRGFFNMFKVYYAVVNLTELNSFDANTEVTPELLAKKNFIRVGLPVKVLGGGSIDRPLSVTATKFSDTAEKKIVAAGGKVTRL